MKRKVLVGLIAVVMVASVAVFAGYTEGKKTGSEEFRIPTIVFCSEEPTGGHYK